MSEVTKEHLDSELTAIKNEIKGTNKWLAGILISVLLGMLAILFNMSQQMASFSQVIGENKGTITQVEKRLDRHETARANWN